MDTQLVKVALAHKVSTALPDVPVTISVECECCGGWSRHTGDDECPATGTSHCGRCEDTGMEWIVYRSASS